MLTDAIAALSIYNVSLLNNNDFSKVKLPQFEKVEKVEHLIERENGRDLFQIIFKNDEFASAHASIISAKLVFKERDFFVAMNLCKSALREIEEKSNKEKYSKYESIHNNLTTEEKET